MADSLQCWHCGAAIDDLPVPLARLETCRSCTAELHVCRLCEFYDTSVARHCREPIADEVKEKTRANFCGYFQPVPDAFVPHDERPARRAEADLAALFGDAASAGPTDADSARAELDTLFGKKDRR